MSPYFLMLNEVIKIHNDQIERYGGAKGIRDLNLLLSAIAMPPAGIGEKYLHEDIFEMATAYLFHIVENHPFIDGNKRTGLVSALVFLKLNGININTDEDSMEQIVRAISRGESDKDSIAKFFKNHLQK